jgi:hypothetical protein
MNLPTNNSRPSYDLDNKSFSDSNSKVKLEDVKKISQKLRFCTEEDIKKFDDM